MSLINDALKRASKTDKNRPPQAEVQGRLKPVADEGVPFLGLAMGAGVVLALALAGWFFWQWWHGSHPSMFTRGNSSSSNTPQPSPPPGVYEGARPASATAAVSASPSPAQPVEQAWPAELKLMGIIYNNKKSLALINGQTLGVGEAIAGIHITKIDPDRVSVEWNGQMKVLRLQ